VIALYSFDHELRRAPLMTSKSLLAEIRLTWWGEVLDQIYGGQPVRAHPTAQALAAAVGRRSLPREPLDVALDARLYALEGDRDAGEVEAAGAIAEAAAVALDAGVDREAVRALGQAWRAGALSAEAKQDAKRVSAAAFPAVAHAALAGRGGGDLARRLRLTWAVARGRV
jgi:phytoene synthase